MLTFRGKKRSLPGMPICRADVFIDLGPWIPYGLLLGTFLLLWGPFGPIGDFIVAPIDGSIGGPIGPLVDQYV